MDRAVRDYGAETVRVVWKHFPLSTHPDARLAARASWAAQQQGKFWEFHDKVFGAFPTKKGDAAEWTEQLNSFLKPAKLKEYAADLNLDVAKFERDMNSQEATAAVNADVELGNRLGIHSTPSIMVNGRKVNFRQGVSYDAVRQLIEEEASKANEIMEAPNAYYSYAVHANRVLPDGIKTAPSEGAAVADAGAVEGGEAAKDARAGAAPTRPSGAAAADKAAAPSGAKGTGPDVSKLPIKGNPNAKVTLVEFSDFQCPFCSKVNPTIDQLLKEYPNDLRVAFAQFPLNFHKDAHLAAQASLAAHEQGKFWPYHDLLFQNQKALKRADLERYAEQVGLNMAKFKAALDSGKYKDEVDAQMASGKAFGVTGTPSMVINGVKFVGAQPVAAFKKVIDKELKRANQVAAAKKLSGEALYKELVRTAPREAPKPKQKKPEPADEARKFVPTAGSPIKGNPKAPVTIVEFSDFQCPFCSKATNTLNELVKKNPGKVKVVFKHFPLDFHKDAPLAHRASIAAQKQGKFWEYHDLLFENAKALKKDNLISYAQQLGLDMAKFKADLENPELDKRINADKAAGAKVSVRGTPHFFINGTRFSGAQPLQAFQDAVDREHKIAMGFIKKGTPPDKVYKTVVEKMKNEKPKVEVDVKGAPAKGAKNAKVTLIEFSDFQCPFCSKVNPTIDRLLKEYPNDLKVVFKHQPLPFHKDAHLAAQASLAAHEQGKFWAYHDLLFQNQKALKRADLEKYAEQIGLNMAKFKSALDSGKFKSQVDADMAQARSAGISGTPSFLINGQKFVGAQPYEKFKAQVDAALGK